MTQVRSARTFICALCCAAAACETKTTNPPELSAPASLVLVSGDTQTVVNGPAAAPKPLVVKVLDPKTRPVPDVAVTWTASDTSARLSAASTTTAADGTTQVTWTLGTTAGGQTVTAATVSIPGARVAFQATNAVSAISGGITFSPLPPIVFSRVSALGPAAAAARVAAGGANATTPSGSRDMRRGTPTRRLVVQLKSTAVSSALPSGARAALIATSGETMRAMRQVLEPYRSANLVAAPELSPVVHAARVLVPEGVAIDDAIAALRNDAAVAAVTIDSLFPMLEPRSVMALDAPPRAASVGTQGLAGAVPGPLPNNPYLLAELWHYDMIDAPRAWATTTGSANVLVAVVDNGIRFDHPALGGTATVAGNLTHDGYNFVTGGNRLSSAAPVCGGGTTVLPEAGYGSDPTQPDDFYYTGTCWQHDAVGGHGTHVAGTIGAVGNDGIGTSGINWTVRIRPVRVLDITGSGSYFDIAQGVLYAAGLPASDGNGHTIQAPAGGASVINMSLGGTGNDPTLAAAVVAATNNGSLIIAAAGNSDANGPLYPAAYSQVVAVAALGPDLQLASYTNIGSAVSLSAPGGEFRSSNTAGVASSVWDFTAGSPTYAYYEGTSMAAPHVTGVAALVLAVSPGLTNAQLRARLQNTAIHLGAPGRDDRYGYGLVNAYNAVNNVTGPPRAAYVRVVSAARGDTVRTVAVAADRSYLVTRVPPGNYFVFAGEDEGGDKRIGVPGRRFGWYGPAGGGGGGGPPGVITVGPGQTVNASIAIGAPAETKPNGSLSQANRLVVNSYVMGHITSTDTAAYFTIVIPRTASYYFETGGVLGSCGYGIEVNTKLDLMDVSGNVLSSNDDATFPGSVYCSALSGSLTQATYTLRVRGSIQSPTGQYRLWIRDQP